MKAGFRLLLTGKNTEIIILQLKVIDMSQLLTTTDESFESDVLQSETPVLVDFFAVWCAPCKVVKPVLEELAHEYHGVLKMYALDIDISEATPARYGVRGIPTLLLFKGGEVVGTKIGAITKAQMTAFIDSNL
jgi:thioredoxin 1